MPRILTYYCPEPTCRSPMVKRKNKATGQLFYACSEYPRCKATIPIPEREKMLLAGATELPGFETEDH